MRYCFGLRTYTNFTKTISYKITLCSNYGEQMINMPISVIVPKRSLSSNTVSKIHGSLRIFTTMKNHFTPW